MRIYTITTQFANNMGAILQCYALSRFLNKQEGIECEVINYFPKRWKDGWVIFPKPESFRDVIKSLYDLFNVPGLIRWRKKNNLTKRFISKHIPLTKEAYYSEESICINPPLADAYICGSDQIWNFTLFQDPVYFLSFTKNIKNCKRIAYAPSIADDWTAEQEKIVGPYLELFDNLSIREVGNLPQIKRLTSKDVKVVIDPVFLLKVEDWNSIHTDFDIEEPFLLCYFLSVSDLSLKAVKKMKELTGLKIVYLNHNTLDKLNSDIEIRDFDPAKFVTAISKATYVCTNSFHCSAFSIIYKKNFMFVPGMRNKRVENLQELFGLGNRLLSEDRLDNLTLSDLEVDYTKGSEKGCSFINESKTYLLSSLKS